ncbi:MAG: TAXI family TRAP transporter solute-binding subunit [Thermodesulforhabdaceae bacterium]|jgi:TRAP transporter TAXI family solute receptor
MKKWLVVGLAVLGLIAGGFAMVGQAAKVNFVTIGTGGITGVYYPTGGAICQMLNKKKETYGIRCTVESTGGSVFNINAVLAGDMDFGIAQSDIQFKAVKGTGEWQEKGPQKDLRAVFSLHTEAVTLVAADDAGIKSVEDLKGKRVNIGNPGSGQLQNCKDILPVYGIDIEKDIKAEQAKAAEGPGLLQDNRIDAFFYTVGHPNGAIKEATAGARKARLVPIAGPKADEVIKKYPYYVKTVIPMSYYPSAVNKEDVQTLGVKATLITSAKVPEEVVYALVKEVFDNLDDFKTLHPAYAELTREKMLEGLSAPFHPGALKYFKEKGLIKE